MNYVSCFTAIGKQKWKKKQTKQNKRYSLVKISIFCLVLQHMWIIHSNRPPVCPFLYSGKLGEFLASPEGWVLSHWWGYGQNVSWLWKTAPHPRSSNKETLRLTAHYQTVEVFQHSKADKREQSQKDKKQQQGKTSHGVDLLKKHDRTSVSKSNLFMMTPWEDYWCMLVNSLSSFISVVAFKACHWHMLWTHRISCEILLKIKRWKWHQLSFCLIF